MRSARRSFLEVLDNPVLVGTVTILVVLVAVYLSYIAENGLPFVPTYQVKVQVADAAELVKNADVRIGGARVGQVLKIQPELPDSQYHQPYAELTLQLEKSLEPIQSTTKYQVRLASVLGGKYVELIPGKGGTAVPDGGTLQITSNTRTNHNIPFVDLDTAFKTFGPKTRAGIRSFTEQLGEAVAGRGTDFNNGIHSTRLLIGPLENLLRLFADPTSGLPGFITGLDNTMRALAPVSPQLSSLMANGGTTFTALNDSNLGAAIDAFPPTERVATGFFTNARPVLADAATLAKALRPGAALLPSTGARIDAVLRASPKVFRRLPETANHLLTALVQVKNLAVDPASVQVFKVLGSNDLGTTGASAFVGLGAILNAVSSQQFACNTTGGWISNFASALSEGDSTAGWLRIIPVIDSAQLTQAKTISGDLHANSYPVEDTSQCQSGNEVYSGTQSINNPGQTSTAQLSTAPPAGVLAEGKKAGLVP